MAFPNTTKRYRLAFWIIMLVAGFVTGVVFVKFEAIVDGQNPLSTQLDRIYESDVSSFGIFIGVFGAVVVACVVFGVWALVSMLLFFLLSWFDKDLWLYSKQMVGPQDDTSSIESDKSNIDIASRAVTFAWISGFLSFTVMAIYFGIG